RETKRYSKKEISLKISLRKSMPENGDWISDVFDSVEHVETPRSWIWFSLCSAVSAAAANNYHMMVLKGTVMIKPNIYVILLGESGLGKEFPIFIAQELVQRAEVTRVISGRSSIQAIVKELSTAKTRPDKPRSEEHTSE